MRARTLPRGERDKLDAAVRVERVDEGLCKRAKAADECLPVVEVREALCVFLGQRRVLTRLRRIVTGWGMERCENGYGDGEGRVGR